MLTPKQLENIPERLVEIYSEVETDIIADMAARISKMDFIPSAEWQYRKLIEMGAVHEEVLKKLSRITGLRKREIERLMKEAGVKVLRTDMKIYKAAGLKPSLLDVSPALQHILRIGIDATNGLFENLTRTTANTATMQFEHALDRAWLNINSGAFSHTEAIRMAIKDLTEKGLAAIKYPSGHTDYLDVAVRRATVTGVNQTALKLQEQLASEMGCDLVEVTAHAGARVGEGVANHAEWQGKIYSRSGTHPKYPSLVEATGYGTGEGLGGWNCRHSFFPFIEGVSEPTYTQEELEEMNAKKYTYDGIKMTEYEATQKLRSIERNIRRWKREYKAMEAAGLSTDEAAAKLAKWQEEQKSFLEQTGLKRQYAREEVQGFGRSDAAKVQGIAKAQKKLAIKQEIDYNKKREEIHKLIRSDKINKKINVGAQNKHIKGAKGYIQGRSYIYEDLETAQMLVDKYHGTGEIRLYDGKKWNKKEFVYVDYDIGVLINPDTGEETPTNAFSIRYGKKGTHVVPANRREIK